ncbi:unnamed protein product [Notodromas monacha]|uniref:Kinesin motor domain-containing protein n=1 Tax=Notodromas monacha TaxID=399045 RepID=A0A7R9BSP1_9CRUS|nr:unnamed protein product [Notodromas monacha]CAG0919393.1 unnamed protein product [Notodromas monacha]
MDHPSPEHSFPITVGVRVRPLTTPASPGTRAACLRVFPDNNRIAVLNGPPDGNTFQFSSVFHPNTSQQLVYETLVHPLMEPFIDGQNGCILGYGPSGCGKTYSLMGSALSCAMNESDFGMLQRFLRDLFQITEVVQNRNFSVSVSYVEVYQNLVRDLLNVDEAGNFVSVLLDKEGRVVLHGMLEIDCRTPSEAIACLDAGSRDFKEERASTMTFVDCGTSSVVNPGLVSLTGVVRSLISGQPPPYHSSSLTTVLRDAFGGNCRTVFLCCVSAAVSDFAETIESLLMSRDVSLLRNFPVYNRKIIPGDDINDNLNNNVDPSEEHCEQIKSGDQMDSLFRLQFAAKQYEQLLEGAEELLTSVLFSLPGRNGTDDERARIQTWLCLKQECQECVADAVCSQAQPIPCLSEDSRRGSKAIPGLEVIDEVTEPSEHDATFVADEDDQEDEDDDDSDGNEGSFWDSLHQHEQHFRILAANSRMHNAKTILEKLDRTLNQMDAETSTCNLMGLPSSFQLDQWDEHVRGEIKRLLEDAETKENRVKRFDVDLKILQDKIADLNETLKLKEDLKAELLKQGENAEEVKLKFEKKIKQLEQQCKKQNVAVENETGADNSEDVVKLRKKIERYENKLKGVEVVSAEGYMKRVADLELSLHLMNEEQERLRLQLKEEQDRKARLEKDMLVDHEKMKLLEGLIRRQETILKLSSSFHQQKSHQISEELRNFEGAEQFKAELVNIVAHQRWLDEEENRLIKLRCQNKDCAKEDSARPETLEIVQQVVENTPVGNSIKSPSRTIDASVGPSRDADEGEESVRNEIRSLRVTRDSLTSERQTLDFRGKILTDSEEKRLIELDEAIEAVDTAIEYKNDVICSRGEPLPLVTEANHQRSLFVVAVFTTIRSEIRHQSIIFYVIQTYAFEIIKTVALNDMSRKSRLSRALKELVFVIPASAQGPGAFRLSSDVFRVLRRIDVFAVRNLRDFFHIETFDGHHAYFVTASESDTSLVARLMNLSPMECKSLLYKYFLKVIDLRDQARQQEFIHTELETKYEEQQGYIQQLSAALHHANLEKERKVASLQKEYEEKMAVLLQQLGGQHSFDSTSVPSIESLTRKLRAREKELSYYKHASREYKKKLKDVLNGRNIDTEGMRLTPSPPPSQTIPVHKLRPLAQAMGHSVPPNMTTKVTREKNKLVIQRDYASGSGQLGMSGSRSAHVPGHYYHGHASGSPNSPGHPNYDHTSRRFGGNDHHHAW